MSAIGSVLKHALSFQEFVRLSEHQRKRSGKATIIPPQLGEAGFGRVVLEKPVLGTFPGRLLKRYAGR